MKIYDKIKAEKMKEVIKIDKKQFGFQEKTQQLMLYTKGAKLRLTCGSCAAHFWIAKG